MPAPYDIMTVTSPEPLRCFLSDAGEARTTLKSPEAGDQMAFTLLRARLEAYALDKPDDAIPFTTRLAAECGWSHDKARRVAFEYKRFVAIALSNGQGACPSRAVDEAWHLHLIDTRRYWGEFCRDVLQRDFHHEPGRGGIAEDLHFDRLYRQTLADYRRFFGEEPPAEIWPEPDAAGPMDSARSGRQALLPRLRGLLKRAVKPLAFLALLLAVPGCAAIYNSSSPGALQGSGFLTLYVVLLAGAILLSRALQDALKGSSPPATSSRVLELYHLAFLAGGTRRVFETAMTRLYVDGTVAIQSGDAVLLRPVSPQAPALERLIGERLADGPWRVESVAIEREAEPIRRDLIAAGFVPGQAELARARQLPYLVIGPLFLLGLTRLWHGIAVGRPIGFLLCCLVVTAMLAVNTAKRKPMRTWTGRRALKEAERAHRTRGKPAADSPALTDWVALHGDAGLAGLGLTSFSLYLASPSTIAFDVSADTGGSSDGGSCGGGCGGGGCGG